MCRWRYANGGFGGAMLVTSCQDYEIRIQGTRSINSLVVCDEHCNIDSDTRSDTQGLVVVSVAPPPRVLPAYAKPLAIKNDFSESLRVI